MATANGETQGKATSGKYILEARYFPRDEINQKMPLDFVRPETWEIAL